MDPAGAARARGRAPPRDPALTAAFRAKRDASAPDVRLVTSAELPVPDPETPLVRDSLEALGVRAEIRAWDDPGADWSAAPLTVIRSTWDYCHRPAAFLDWARRAAGVTRLCNPEPVVRWNAHKRYLLELEARGVAVVPTELVPAGATRSLAACAGARGWEEVVVKPAVSLGALGTRRFARDAWTAGQAHLDALVASGDALVQPFAASVASRGELSIVFVDGAPVHAVRKRPARGDYRVQEDFGGSAEPVSLDPETVARAERALACIEGDLLYARVDLVRVDGEDRVMELELIEPSLFLEPGSAALDAFARAIAARL